MHFVALPSITLAINEIYRCLTTLVWPVLQFCCLYKYMPRACKICRDIVSKPVLIRLFTQKCRAYTNAIIHISIFRFVSTAFENKL